MRADACLGHELGIERGDRFAVLAMNGHEFIELYHAALFGAGVINPSTSASARPSSPTCSTTPAARWCSPTRCSPRWSTRPGTRRGPRSRSSSSSAGTARRRDHGRDDDSLSPTRTSWPAEPVMPPDPEEDDPACSCTPAGPTGSPRAPARPAGRGAQPVPRGAPDRPAESRRSCSSRPCSTPPSWPGWSGSRASGGTSVSIPLFDPSSCCRSSRAGDRHHHDRSRSCCRCSRSTRASRPAPQPAPDRLRGGAHRPVAHRALVGDAPRHRLPSGLRHDRGGLGAHLPRPDEHRDGANLLTAAAPRCSAWSCASPTRSATPLARGRRARCAPGGATSCASTGASRPRTAEALRGRLVPHR